MKRINDILAHELYRECVNKTELSEVKREYCKHDMAHFIDTARIAYILCLEEGLSINKELIYAAALLHDIGRFRQYIDGTPHEKESARLAALILPECGFSKSEEAEIISAISTHRSESAVKNPLGEAIYKGDKLSRQCRKCEAGAKCNWPKHKKNLGLEY